MNRMILAAALAAITAPLSAHTAAAASTAAFEPSRFSVVVVGKGPDVILIPGLSSTRHVWDLAAEHLKSGHRVHLIQLKGFGEPAGANATGPVLKPFVDELAAYIAARKLSKPAVVGHSMGGLAALMLGADHPALAGKLMIVDAFPFIGPVFGADSVEALAPRADQLRSMVMAQAGKTVPDYATPPACPATLRAPDKVVGNMTNSGVGACLMRHGALASDPRVVGQAMHDDMMTDLRPRMKDLTVPVTMLYPQDDRLVSQAEADALYAAAYAGTRTLTLRRIAGSYHFIMLDQPALFEKELDAFLAR